MGEMKLGPVGENKQWPLKVGRARNWGNEVMTQWNIQNVFFPSSLCESNFIQAVSDDNRRVSREHISLNPLDSLFPENVYRVFSYRSQYSPFTFTTRFLLVYTDFYWFWLSCNYVLFFLVVKNFLKSFFGNSKV